MIYFWAIFGLGLIVFVHEFGHFISAKLLGVKVEEFMLGLPGPKIFTLKRRETIYGVTIVPFGGYVKLAGEFGDQVSKKERKKAFFNQPLWKKLFIIFSGPLMNFILPIFLIAILFIQGVDTPSTTIGRVLSKTPAEKIGLKSGDKIVKIAGKQVNSWDDIIKIIRSSPLKKIKVEVKRDGKLLRFFPILSKRETFGFLGIESKLVKERVGVFVALVKGIGVTVTFTIKICQLLYKVIAENLFFKVASGPIGIAVETARAVRMGFDVYFYILAFISLNVMVVNLLPFPPLDGGRLFLLVLEGIRKKPIKAEKMAFIQLVGLALFLFLMLYLITADLQRYGLWRYQLWKLEKF